MFVNSHQATGDMLLGHQSRIVMESGAMVSYVSLGKTLLYNL